MNEPWVSKLTEIVQKRVEQNEPFKRGELSKIYEELATEFKGSNPTQMLNYYYRVLKKLWGENDSLDSGSSKKATNKKSEPLKKKKARGVKPLNDEEQLANLEQLNNVLPNEQQDIKNKLIENQNKIDASETEPIKLTFLKSYPAPSIQINSFEEETEPTTEWLNFSQVNRNLTGDSFDQYVRTLKNGDLIRKGLFNNKELEIIEINNLKRILGTFSGYSRNKKEVEQIEAIASILKADETTISKKREEYFFNSLKPNDIVEVQIKKLMDYGAIAHLTEYPSIVGLLHIGQIIKGFVKDIQEYLYEGQILNVKIINKENNKLVFSTKDFDIKPITELAAVNLSFEETASSIENNSPPILFGESIESNKETEELEENKTPTADVNVSFEKALNNANFNKEWEHIVKYVKNAVGPLSPDAKSKTVSLINEFGLFNFALALQSTSFSFKADMGLLLLRETEMKLRDGL